MDVTVVGRIEFRHGAESTRSTVEARSGSGITRRRSRWPSTRTCSRATCPTSICLEGGNTGATSPAETGRNGSHPEDRKPAWFL